MGSPTETIRVTNYAADRYERLRQTVNDKDKGLKMVGNDGEMKDYGAVVDYDYSSLSLTLTLIVKHGPHFKNFDDFCASLKSWVLAQV
jgi:hypothetical protein